MAKHKGEPMLTGTIVDAPDPHPETMPQATNILAVIDRAVASKTDPATMERMFALYERMEAMRARKEFAEAMSAFKADCPPIPRRTENAQFKVTRDGVTRARRYAALEDIEATIREPLGKHGLSFRWGETKVADGILTMACVVSHVGGHSESSAVSLPIDSKAGCSDQQKTGAAMTYAQRYSLVQALGLTSCDEDDDGNDLNAGPKITPHDADKLDTLIENVGANRDAFLKFMGVASLADIPAARFSEAVAALERKRKAAQ